MNETLGARIKELREECSLTQENVSERLNISRQKLARIEKGQTDISYDLIVKLSNIFNVDTHEITKVVKAEKEEVFRTGGNSTASFSKIEDIVDMFFANRTLYNRINVEIDDE